MKVFRLALFLVPFSVLANDIVGQTADYQIDKDPARTSSIIKSGTMKVSVANFLESTPQGPAYEVIGSYKVNLGFLGTHEGSDKMNVEKEYFTPEFLETLRKEKEYSGDYFKAKHLGYQDAKNLDGKMYKNCDLVLLYDMKKPGLIEEMIAAAYDVERHEIEDAEALVHIYPGVPVLGGVKIDASGTYSGSKVKVGGDYKSK